jgi:tRNA nucleotidyltransferase (CCA-adding enzyme)
MVRKSLMDSHGPIDPRQLGPRLEAAPALRALRDALAGEPAYLVGGVVRDLLLDIARTDVDVAVEGDAVALARELDPDAVVHDRFGTATAELAGLRVDLASTRSETYANPGALPVVEPASLGDDLARRDFTINAMALPLTAEPELIDPHAGVADLAERRLRVLHERSFADDPTRALRAARYCARLGLEPEPTTAALLAATDLSTVSADRVEAELARAAAEEDPAAVFARLASWGLAGVDAGAPARINAMCDVLSRPEWSDVLDRGTAVRASAIVDPQIEAAALRLASARPETPSEGIELVRGRAPLELVAGRAAGAAWLDDWAMLWRHAELEIDGQDLIAAGVAEGPAVGRGLAAAMKAKLNGLASSREDQLRIALAAARAAD